MLPSNGKRLDGEWTDEHAGECTRFIADLEAKVAALEEEKEALQRRLVKSSEEKATLTTELLAAADRAVKAEDAAKAVKLLKDDNEKRRVLCTNVSIPSRSR